MVRKRYAILASLAIFPAVIAQNPVAPQPPLRIQPEIAQPRALPATITNTLFAEPLLTVDPKTISVKRQGGQWQLWVNDKSFRNFGDNGDDANDVARTMRELLPQRWGRIGTDRTVVEYGLTVDNDQKLVAPQVAAFARNVIAWNPKTLRVEQVRGLWCLRDDANLLLNFGMHKDDADFTMAVIQKHGFNRIATVGRKEVVMTFLTSAPEGLPVAQSILPAAAQFKLQEEAMTRTGIPVPRLGYVGEMTKIDPRKLELRFDRGEHVLASGSEILAKFGIDDWAARDALRLLREKQLTEFCKYGTAGVSFFLANGKVPQNMPLHTLGPRFDPNGLRVRELNGKWWVTDQVSRPLLPAGSQKEAEELMKVIQAFGFDQLCNVNSGTKPVMTILAKGR